MKRVSSIMLIMMLALSALVSAQSAATDEMIVADADHVINTELKGNAGVTPDSFLWNIETAMENLNVALTFGGEEKAKKRSKIAEERLMEARIMAESNKIDAVKKASASHKKNLEKLREDLQKVQNENLRAELKTEIKLEQDLKGHEAAAAALATKIEIMSYNNLTPVQKQHLLSLVESFRNESRITKLEVQAERSRAKLKIRAKESVSKEKADEIDDIIEVEVQAEKEAKGKGEQIVATQFIKIAESTIKHAEEKMQVSNNDSKVKAMFHLNNAQLLIKKAKDALEKESYVESRNFALEARREAHTSFTVSSGKEVTSDQIQKSKEALSDRRLQNLQDAVVMRNEKRMGKEKMMKENQTLKGVKEKKVDSEIIISSQNIVGPSAIDSEAAVESSAIGQISQILVEENSISGSEGAQTTGITSGKSSAIDQAVTGETVSVGN